jgi:hypothetical protein
MIKYNIFKLNLNFPQIIMFCVDFISKSITINSSDLNELLINYTIKNCSYVNVCFFTNLCNLSFKLFEHTFIVTGTKITLSTFFYFFCLPSSNMRYSCILLDICMFIYLYKEQSIVYKSYNVF